ncbi:putative UPF0481 protein At3g02645 [Prunus avium]|uniref:UPF0481 protein At3g02645 n=1 Tax=Prunus avium TaxID=42229 RepID=A0A6P5TKM5_PRUAV|nr:putative UPF0481 protein At3g02645 [Prunus avium]
MEVEGRSNEAPHDVENPNTPVADLKRRLDSLSRRSSDECCIYRVPLRLRGKNNSYTPEVVSIGPIHHDNKELEAMEEYKQRYLQYFLHRNNKVSLEYYVEKIKAQEDKLRGCYGNAQHVKNSDKFVSIILVDAAFVIELLLRYYFVELRDDDDWIFKKPWMLTNIVPDMLLLENQLPFFILEVLFDPSKVRVESAARPSIIKLSYHFFEKVVGLQMSEGASNFSSSSERPLHFVDFIRTLHLENLDTSRAGRLQSIPSVTKLHQAGVKFRVESSNHLFAIRFHNGTLKIPKLKIHDDTEVILRNLIAFEQCHCTGNYLSDYVFLLDKFVDTKRDVDLLVESEIVVNTLGDNNKVSTMINQLCKGVALDQGNFHFGGLADDLNKYCKKCRNRWMAYLSQKYFYTPWAAFSLFAAVTLLILTVIQTVFTIISVYQR